VKYDVDNGDSAMATLHSNSAVQNCLSYIPTGIRQRVPMKINVDSRLQSQEITGAYHRLDVKSSGVFNAAMSFFTEPSA
jgi:hypothetical protein